MVSRPRCCAETSFLRRFSFLVPSAGQLSHFFLFARRCIFSLSLTQIYFQKRIRPGAARRPPRRSTRDLYRMSFVALVRFLSYCRVSRASDSPVARAHSSLVTSPLTTRVPYPRGPTKSTGRSIPPGVDDATMTPQSGLFFSPGSFSSRRAFPPFLIFPFFPQACLKHRQLRASLKKEERTSDASRSTNIY